MQRRVEICLKCLLATFLILLEISVAQDRLKTLPGYEQYSKMNREIQTSVKRGALRVTWKDGGKALEYAKDGKGYRFDLATTAITETGAAADEPPGFGGRGGGRGQGGGPARGRQFDTVTSPDGKRKAFYRDRNVWVSEVNGANEAAVTMEGNEKTRIKYGTASWVYGEELNQRSALWWSPDSKQLAYYRFDESQVPDYFLQLSQTKLQSTLDIEAYPKPGVPNPVVDLFVYDLESRKKTQIDLRDGKPFEDAVVGHYAYNIEWSPDGTELLINRSNRRQNILELAACAPDTGKCRTVVREEWPASWTENHPNRRFLKDGKRFIWSSERTGFKNFYLYDLAGRLLTTITNHPFEVGNIVRVDEAAGVLVYTAHDGDNHMKLQLHRVGLDGKGDKRLTDPSLNHAVDVAPDGLHFIDVAEAHDKPPITCLMDANGKMVAELATSDMTKFEQLGLKRVELFTYKAADEKTELHGLLHRPSGFDPQKKYPLLVSVYAGPATNGARESFILPSATTELGFLVASLDSRSAGGRGKRFLDSIYQRLGIVEIDDQAAGVKALRQRPYVDGAKVGIYGTSYGGYASVMCLLRYPDVFQAACASSSPTDWRNYDTIYTERYMWIPQENKEGYDGGSALTYAEKLSGRLLLYYGTADNNVHSSNTMQLISALQKAGKSFEVQVGPDLGHSGLRPERMLEFFVENLVLR